MPGLEGPSLLITARTGPFGKTFLTHVLMAENSSRVKTFSRDKVKTCTVKPKLGDDARAHLFVGYTRDRDRLRLALHRFAYVYRVGPQMTIVASCLTKVHRRHKATQSNSGRGQDV